MLKLSGVDALVKIKALKPATPVVMMTAYLTEQASDEARQKGAFDYLTKPCVLEDLIQKIHEAIAKRR